ncbi:hypothetical protein AVEN_178864-1 [Araneus ventricosus]|uniref:Uncharacterized protein n=1 Tax=Araneus ventricosus TaxID=182803 RepID=A0A4Y2BFV6_ARAVE|nr:hypothetical protein AVEN_178864-1 [Araneus ventricosus]
MRHTKPNVVFSELMTLAMPQEQFLSNDCNKGRLIAMLSVKLKSEGFSVTHATEDADNLIVNSATVVGSEEHKCAALVGEYIDLSSYSQH